MKFTLPNLAYSFDAMEPYIDALTMQIHYTKHHAAYIDNLNKELEHNGINFSNVEDILKNVDQHNPKIRNNAGGHYNHTFFWKIISKQKSTISEKLTTAINKYFGSLENFKNQFYSCAMQHFGSGWAWLCIDKNKDLFITSTPNQDNTIMNIAHKQGEPLLGLDVWEHAYYLKYQNRRAEYIEAFWNVVNWGQVSLNFEELIK
jgi:Fe-Mn family superoxide dismutase